MDDKFSAHYDSVEQEIKANTVSAKMCNISVKMCDIYVHPNNKCLFAMGCTFIQGHRNGTF